MRVIAGHHRGRTLKAPKGNKTRPTTDRVREALFAILGDLTGLAVIDCYAGSGALGIEALSRGAAHAVFIEAQDAACRVIAANLDALQLSGQATLLSLPVERAGKRLDALAPFDLVLSDPPWPIAAKAAVAVVQLMRSRLRPGASLVLGHPKRAPLELEPRLGVELTDRRTWGDSAMSWYRLTGTSPE